MKASNKLQASPAKGLMTEQRHLSARLLIATAAWVAGLTGLGIGPGLADPQDPRGKVAEVRVRYTNQRTVLVRYRWAGARPKGVQLWTSQDGRVWTPHRWSDNPAEPLVLTARRPGKMFVAVTAAPQAAVESRADLAPALSVVFDWDRPLLKLLSARRIHGADGPPALHLTWSAWDENFGDRPISIYWRRSENEPWQLSVRDLPNAGSYEWPLPAEIGRQAFSVSLRATDQAGNSAEAVYRVSRPDESKSLRSEMQPPAASRPTQAATATAQKDPAAPATQPRPADFAEAQRLHRLASAHLSRSEFATAEALLRRAIELDPSFPQARSDLANLLQRSKRYKEAIAQYEALVALKPDSVAGWRNLALAYMATKNYDMARNTLQKLLAIRPGNAQTWLDLGDVEMLAARPDLAKWYWQKAKSLAKSDPAAAARAAKRLAIYLKGR